MKATTTTTQRTGQIQQVTTSSAAPAAPVVPVMLLDPTAQYSTKDCAVHVISEDCIEVVFRIEGQDLRRYKSRMAGGRNWAEYIWDNVLRRAILGYVY